MSCPKTFLTSKCKGLSGVVLGEKLKHYHFMGYRDSRTEHSELRELWKTEVLSALGLALVEREYGNA